MCLWVWVWSSLTYSRSILSGPDPEQICLCFDQGWPSCLNQPFLVVGECEDNLGTGGSPIRVGWGELALGPSGQVKNARGLKTPLATSTPSWLCLCLGQKPHARGTWLLGRIPMFKHNLPWGFLASKRQLPLAPVISAEFPFLKKLLLYSYVLIVLIQC